jgi:uncharacterized glyoxalase superfamily protein PhnB
MSVLINQKRETVMAFMPYNHFDGTCAEAMAYYSKLFGGTDLQFMKYGDLPPDTGGQRDDRPTRRGKRAASV